MPSLTRKKIHGHFYYYLRQCKWVNGKPKITRTQYLGTAEQIEPLFHQKTQPALPEKTTALAFGNVSLCYSIVQELGLADLIDQCLPKRNQGLKFSDYLFISVINRAVEARSKSQMEKWVAKTALPDLMNLKDLSFLTPQHFWNHADEIFLPSEKEKEFPTSEKIDQAVTLIRNRCIEKFNLSLEFLHYDTTNYFTTISTFNSRSQFAKRGKNKQKRDDLRQVNWALAVSEKDHIPLFQKVYPGNINDVKEFPLLIPELEALKTSVPGKPPAKITVVVDTGNWSEAIAQKLKKAGLDWITSLTPSYHPDLASIPLDEKNFSPVEGRKGIQAHKTTKKLVLDKENPDDQQTVVVVFNATMFEKELKTYVKQKDRAYKELQDLQRRLENTAKRKMKKKPRERISIEMELKEILSPAYLKGCFPLRLEGAEDGYFRLIWSYDDEAFQTYIQNYCGKEFLATSRKDLSMEEIVNARFQQAHIELAFKITKDETIGGWWPMYHWTDTQIMVHAFCCYLSLLILSIIQKWLKEFNIKVGIHALMTDVLKWVLRLDLHYRNKKGKTQTFRTLCEMDSLQEKVVEAFRLKKYL